MKKLLQHFAVPVEERPAFRDAIHAMVARGRLIRLHGTRYALPQRLGTLAGVVRRHPDGYGFVVLEDENEDDVYIPRRYMSGVMHGDRVLVRLETPQRPRAAGAGARSAGGRWACRDDRQGLLAPAYRCSRVP